MYMSLKPNTHKRISFNTTSMTSLGFIGAPNILGPPLNLAPPPNLIFCSGPPPNYFGLNFLGHFPKIRGGLLPCFVFINLFFYQSLIMLFNNLLNLQHCLYLEFFKVQLTFSGNSYIYIIPVHLSQIFKFFSKEGKMNQL